MRMSNYTLKKGAHAYNVHLVYKKTVKSKTKFKTTGKKIQN